MEEVNSTTKVLQQYVPEVSLALLLPLIRKHPLHLRISKPRKTKFGDYRFPGANGRHRISINHNLNPFAFLITLIHEIAHLEAFLKYGKRIKPHGAEWQQTFREIAYPFLEANIFPTILHQSFIKSLNRGAASSCTDTQLYRALNAYDEQKQDKVFVEDLPLGALFSVNDKMVFKKGPKSRKRYKCTNLKTGREYMVHPLAETLTHKLPTNG